MRRLFCLAAALVLLNTSLLNGQGYRTGLVSNSKANRIGLERKWVAQIEVNHARGEVAHSTLHISSTRLETIFEITFEKKTYLISERHLDAYGKPYGIEGAELAAKEKVDYLKRRGNPDSEPPHIETRVVPEATLYFSTSVGTVHAVNAETGQTKWVKSVGKSRYPTTAAGANDTYVSVVNGSTLYTLAADDGDIQWQRRTQGIPGAGPALSEAFVYVPMISGSIESYVIDDFKRHPWVYKAGGRGLVQPVVTPRTVSWATDRGHLFVAASTHNSIKFRLETQDSIVAKSAARIRLSTGGDVAAELATYLYAASLDGYLYCVAERNGDIVWRFSTGEPISHQPVVIKESVYVVTDEGSLFKVGSEEGDEIWWTKDVSKILASSENRIYCLDRVGRLVVHDVQSGGRLATLSSEALDFHHINIQSDRIYLGMKSGTIQCLKEVGARWPYIHRVEEAAAAQPQDVQLGGENGGDNDKPAAGDGNNPFDPGGGKNPPDPGAGGGNNPFDPAGGGNGGGGGNPPPDPFGNGAAPDPFGDNAGNDPFGF
ncbi:MAG: outer membrane protein assembly factor BamB [Pirellulaceae bacterium]|jgi:outer membrane protein assembly factor BamB